MSPDLKGWSKENMGSQADKTVIVTGANAGIGYQTALAFYQAEADVIVACRDKEKGEKAVDKIKEQTSAGSLEIEILDLSSLKAVEQFADDFKRSHDKLDLLINNAGVMVPPPSKTAEGFELQFGVNFLGHFALTGYLFEIIDHTPKSRIITLSSIAHKGSKIDFQNFKMDKPYNEWREYGQSKLACLMFTLELQRRIDMAGCSVLSLAAHPGISRTELTRNIESHYIDAFDPQDAAQGALPTLMAATLPEIKGGAYYGPDGPDEIRGLPTVASIDPAALDRAAAEKLWETSQAITNLAYPR